MLAKVKTQVSNDPLWAALAGLGAAVCVATLVFGGVEEGSEIYVRLETWAKAMGAFAMGAFARWRVEGGSGDGVG